MFAEAGARAVSQAFKACSLLHLQAFLKENVISRIKMQCAEGEEATRSALF